MWFDRMELEVWFDRYQYEIDFDIGESAVKTLLTGEVKLDLSSVPLRYGYHRGRPDLRDRIASQYPGLSAEHVIVTTGASEANFGVISALMKPGDHVIVEHPNYPSLYEVPRSLGCEVSLFTLSFQNGFKPDIEKLESMIKPKTKLVSLTHPNNPTGSMIGEDDLRRVIEIIESRGIYLLFDETYRHMAFKNNLLPPAASLSPNAISISSMSKCYGLPGIRTGWMATQSKSVLENVLAIREQVSIANNALSEEIAFSVLNRQDLFLDKARDRINNNREIVSDWMEKQREIEWIYPEVGVVCFPRTVDFVAIDNELLYRRLAEKYRTFVVPGRCFEMDNRHFRIGYGADAEEIKSGLANLGKALAELM